MGELKDARDERLSEKAWALGVSYGEANRLVDVRARCEALQEAWRGLNNPPDACEAMDREAIALGCPLSFFDVFKYGAQSVWRERGELPMEDDNG